MGAIIALIAYLVFQSIIIPGKMDLEDLNKLEDKVKNLVSNMDALRGENRDLKEKIEKLEKDNSLNSNEKDEIRNKVNTLIKLIDSIEDET